MKLTVKGKYQQRLNQTRIKGCEKKRYWENSEDQAYDIFGLIKFFLVFSAPLFPLLQNGLKNKNKNKQQQTH